MAKLPIRRGSANESFRKGRQPGAARRARKVEAHGTSKGITVKGKFVESTLCKALGSLQLVSNVLKSREFEV